MSVNAKPKSIRLERVGEETRVVMEFEDHSTVTVQGPTSGFSHEQIEVDGVAKVDCKFEGFRVVETHNANTGVTYSNPSGL